MGVIDGPGDFGEQLGGLARRQRAVGEPLGQRRALDVLHGEIRLAVVLADLVDGDDVGMHEPGGGLGFGPETRPVRFAGQVAAEDHLERDGPIEAELPGSPDDAHAAAAEFGDDLEVAKRRRRAHGLVATGIWRSRRRRSMRAIASAI